ncbi:hypothetical protein B0H14DRAFT_2346163 [Mycena olivaceomarginata]|nr:hypothetical protein B0H14DRAFT_2346163 [Mycena olivaceomarginata]
MILTRGLGRASFMWGSSTHNTRIEWLWVEVGSQFARRPNVIPCLSLYSILSLTSTQDMCFIGQVREGVYVNDYDDVHPTVLQQYYGVHGKVARREPGATGAGQLDDEDIPIPSAENYEDEDSGSEDGDDLGQQLEDAQAENFHHEPVPVPKHANPFPEDETMQLFHDTLSAAEEIGLIPPGYGLLPDEWEDGVYPAMKSSSQAVAVERRFVWLFRIPSGGRVQKCGVAHWLH